MSVKVRERPKGTGVFWIFIDHQGKRKAKKIGRDKRLANEVAKKIEAKLTLGDLHLLDKSDAQVLLGTYAKQWLNGYVVAALKYSTYRGYRIVLNRHLLPQFGKKPLTLVTREEIKSFLFQKMNSGLSAATVRNIKACLSGLYTQALEDGHVQANPVSRLGRMLKAKDESLGKGISPLNAVELELYLEVCERKYLRYYPLFLTLARTGMRLGEALGLQWGDIDFAGQFIEVKRGWVENRITTPKNGKSRFVEMTPKLSSTLKRLNVQRKEETLKRGWKAVPDWVFVNGDGKPIDPGNLRGRVHYKICENAGLRRIRIHDLRHSYATIRISAGHNIADVSKQLGHSSIKITIDIYYHWVPNESRGEVAELDVLGEKYATIRNPDATTKKTGVSG